MTLPVLPAQFRAGDAYRELQLLDDLYQREGAQLLILYGRRRVGKTRLITHWLAELEERSSVAGKPPKHLD